MQEKIKIHKKFLFTEGELLNYLKTVKSFSKVEDEILATITYKRAYEKLHEVSTLVTFPYKQNKEKELSNRPFFEAKDIGRMIKKFVEENSPIDSLLVDPKDVRITMVRPLQIKFLGRGKYQNVTSNKFIELLKHNLGYENNNFTLVVVLEGKIKIQLRMVVDWLKDHEFPFKEVVLIHPGNKTGIMEFFQLKPSKNGFSSMKIGREQMLSGR